MNKTKKVLSIILITLLILSTIFTLCKKVGLCASGGSSGSIVSNGSFPFYFGVGFGYDSTDFSFDPSELYSLSVPFMKSSFTPAVTDVCAIFILEQTSNYIDIVCIPVYSGYTFSVVDYSSQGNVTFSGSAAVPVGRFDGSSISYAGYGSYVNANLSFSSFLTGSSSGGYEYIMDTFVRWYPLYFSSDFSNYFTLYSGGTDSPGFNHYFWQNYQDSIDDIDNNNSIWKPNYQNPSNQQGFWDNVMDFFNRSFKSLLGGISGATKTIGDYIEQFYNGCIEFWTRCWNTIFDKIDELLGKLFPDDSDDSILADTNDSLDSIDGRISSIETKITTFFNNFWSNFDDHLEDFTEGIWGHLPDIMKAPYRIAQWFYQHGLNNGEFDFMTLFHYLFDFDTTTALNDYRANKYGKFTLDVKDFFNTFFGSIINANASDRVFFTIFIGNNLDNTISGSRFGITIPDITIDFSWYAQIRDTYLPYFMAFLYVTVIWLFFKRLPDILRGVAGAESSFMDGLPYTTETQTFVSDGVYTSIGEFSNGGRTRIFYNSYTKK